MAKARIHRDEEGRFYGIKILCPGCKYYGGSPMDHILPLRDLPAGETEMSPHITWRDRWTFNGDYEKPTFSPSLNTWWGNEPKIHRCHSFIRDGKIQFLGDTTHGLANQTVDLIDFPDEKQP